uniref:Nicotinic acetylcholine receptor alpha subunit n=1 Tax=Panagrolaimus sp. JU765 TaxID=591449 RepID=A0AC34QGS3_9BILA
MSGHKHAARLFEDLLADYNKLVRPVDFNSDTLVVRFKLKLSQLLDVHEKNQIMTTNVWLQHVSIFSKLGRQRREADYNKLVRPVDFNSDTLVVRFKLKLSQLLDVHEKNQIMTTNVWLQHVWTDHKLKWNPADYGGVDVLYVPSDLIWLPDIVLYNNADGNYQVTIMTKAKVSHNGTVEWTPPAIYKSMCQIDVEWFPLDAQTCEMRFGSWTYGGLEVDLQHKDSHKQHEAQEEVVGVNGVYQETVWIVDEGIDLSDYYPSVEWDILRVPGKRHEKRYPCCEAPFIDITYEIHLRRKTLFYTVNLIFPSVCISFLTVLVFYLPSGGGEKISLCISILISLTVFFLLLVEIIPSTSLVVPLIGKYLLFTMVLVTLSVVVTVITLNVHYREPSTHKMPNWIKKVFIEFLPYYLFMQRPSLPNILKKKKNDTGSNLALPLVKKESRPSFSFRSRDHNFSSLFDQMDFLSPNIPSEAGTSSHRSSFQREYTPLKSAVDSVTYIADCLRTEEEDRQVVEDWKYVSVVMDRVFLIIFTTACFCGTMKIIFMAPSIYDTTIPLA